MAIPKVHLTQVQRKSGITYVLDYAVNGKRHRQAVGKNKRAAELVAAKLQTDLAHGHFGLTQGNQRSVDLDTLATEYLRSKENTIRDSSLQRYRAPLTTFKDYFKQYFPAACNDVRLIQGKYVKECFDHLLKEGMGVSNPWQPRTVNLLRETARAMFRYGISQGYLNENPIKQTKKYPIPDKGGIDYFTDRELERIWEGVDSYWADPLKLILNTGLRSGEMINLRWKDVDLIGDPPSIKVTSSTDWQTKTGKTRSVPLNNKAQEILRRQEKRHPEYVFISKTGLKINPSRPLEALKVALAKLGLEGDVHKLRHTFASKLVMKGVALYTVGELLGHADLKSTQIYAHLSPKHLQSAVEKLE